MAFTSQEFRLETGYGQTITMCVCPQLPSAILLEVVQSRWDADGNEVGTVSVEAVLEMIDIRALAIALYEAHQMVDPLGESSR